MAQTLTSSQIAVLCDLGEGDPAKLPPDSAGDIEAMLARGFLAHDDKGRYKLTAKGVESITERDAGLNEG